MSIKPEYARAIFAGEKRFEFRRITFKQAVTTVVVYVTSPVCEVWGEFDVAGIISDRPTRLWDRTHDAAGIDRRAFMEYFSGKTEGYAIEIAATRRYDQPLDITRDLGVVPPQSFLYLNRES